MGALKLKYYQENKDLESPPNSIFKVLESPKPRKQTDGKTYQYGFNSYERLDEVSGSGNSYDFGERIYNPRLGKFFSIDPKASSFPYWSPYLFAGNNPTRFIDEYGEGPKDRIKKALSFLKTAYKQQGGDDLRTGTSEEALQYMDCSELVCRVLAADGQTSTIKNMNTAALISYFNKNSEKYMKSKSPKSGDIVLWKGHTGIIKDYDPETKKATVVHATRYGKVSSVVEEKYSLSYYNKKGASFYRPKGENGAYVETENGEEYFNGNNTMSLIRKSIDYKRTLTKMGNHKSMEKMESPANRSQSTSGSTGSSQPMEKMESRPLSL